MGAQNPHEISILTIGIRERDVNGSLVQRSDEGVICANDDSEFQPRASLPRDTMLVNGPGLQEAAAT